MNEEHILFFTSDARALYKADAFRTLALPECHTIQFRYDKKWVLGDILENPQSLKGKCGVVIFAANNPRPGQREVADLEQELNANQEANPLQLIPLRCCVVVDASVDSATEQFVAILQLCQFIDYEWRANSRPPDFYLTRGTCSKFESSTWLDRVRRVEGFFSNTLFFQVKQFVREPTSKCFGLCVRAGEPVQPIYSTDTRTSFYLLEEETDYSMECVYYDPSNTGLPLLMRCNVPYVALTNSLEFGAGGSRDNRKLPVKTGLLPTSNVAALITFYSVADAASSERIKDPNCFQLALQLNRKRWKVQMLAFFVFLAAAGLALVQAGGKDSIFPFSGIVLPSVGVSLVAISGGLLYRFFNKT